jgi:hypothetical protein
LALQFGLEGKQTEPKLIDLNRFSVQFGSKTKKKTVWLFILVQNRTELKMLSPSDDSKKQIMITQVKNHYLREKNNII